MRALIIMVGRGYEILRVREEDVPGSGASPAAYHVASARFRCI